MNEERRAQSSRKPDAADNFLLATFGLGTRNVHGFNCIHFCQFKTKKMSVIFGVPVGWQLEGSLFS